MLSGFATGFAQARQNKLAKANAAFEHQLKLQELQIKQGEFGLNKDKFEYQKTKDASDKDLNERKFTEDKSKNQTDAQFKAAQSQHFNAQVAEIAHKMSKEQLEMQFSYFATWNSLSPQQQTADNQKALVQNAVSSGFITAERGAELAAMPLPTFQLVARAGLSMSANALHAQQYLKPGLDQKAQMTGATELRKEITEQSKPYNNMTDAYNGLLTAGKDPSAAGDVAMMYNYMKLLNPGANAIRPSAIEAMGKAESLPGELQVWYNHHAKGEVLSPELRDDMMKKAQSLYDSAQSQHNQMLDEYRKIAINNRIDPNQVIVNRDSINGQSTKYQLPDGTVVDHNQVIKDGQEKGMTPGESIKTLITAGAKPLSAAAPPQAVPAGAPPGAPPAMGAQPMPMQAAPAPAAMPMAPQGAMPVPPSGGSPGF